LKLIGRYLSPFVRRTAVTLNAYGIPFENVQLGSDDPKVMETNPVGRVPALVLDDGETLIDSNAIIDHLDHEAGPEKSLTPLSGKERREVLRTVAVAVGACEKTVAAAYEQRFRPKELVHRPWLDKLLGQAESGLKALDKQLGSNDWLCLGRMTQADISAGVAFQFVNMARPKLELEKSCPNLARLSAKLAETEAFKAAPLPS